MCSPSFEDSLTLKEEFVFKNSKIRHGQKVRIFGTGRVGLGLGSQWRNKIRIIKTSATQQRMQQAINWKISGSEFFSLYQANQKS